MEIKLRDYQEKQVKFLLDNDNENLLSLQSPTGSGKSVVMISYVKEYQKKYPNKNIVITTGSNKLVFEFYQTALKFGLKPLISIGAVNLACINSTFKDSNYEQIFTQDNDKLCSTVLDKNKEWDESSKSFKLSDRCKWCMERRKPHLIEHKNRLKEDGLLIITNHQAYLFQCIATGAYRADLVLVDEAHLFPQYYDNYINTELNKIDINNTLRVASGTVHEKLFHIFSENKTLLPSQLVKVYEKYVDDYLLKNPKTSKFYYKGLKEKYRQFNSADKSREDVYFSISKDGWIRSNFYKEFKINQSDTKYILISATLDTYTKKMFGIDKDNRKIQYEEKNLNLADYTKSDVIIYRENEYFKALHDFLNLMKQKNYESGLLLSTRLDIIDELSKLNEIDGYKMFTNLDEFRAYNGYKVLIGSRALFQGIDIPEIKFVCINKIPFEKFDDEFKTKTAYLSKHASLNPWSDYTIPLVKNSLIQSTGRLWRGPDDYGTVAIFDNRLLTRFNWLLRDTVLNIRKNINLITLGDDTIEIDEDLLNDIKAN